MDAIWLSPFFPSPMKDFGYDVSDYCGVDPIFGTLDDFDALIARAHALGLRVIIDQVYAHTSDQHPWFVESRASRDNDKADWYVWPRRAAGAAGRRALLAGPGRRRFPRGCDQLRDARLDYRDNPPAPVTAKLPTRPFDFQLKLYNQSHVDIPKWAGSSSNRSAKARG